MTWKVAISVSDAKLGTFLNTLPKWAKFELERVGADSSDSTNGTVPEVVVISLGPNKPKLGTVAGRVCALLEKLEVKHGAHNVTRPMLNDAMKKAKFTKTELSTAVTNAIASGFLRKEGI